MRLFGFRRAVLAVGCLLALCAARASHAAITFFNVNITGSAPLIAGSSYITGSTDIDFSLPNAVVGDFQPLRQGVVTITYEAMSAQPMVMDEMVLTVLGGLSGSGLIQFSEVVEDMVTPGIIGSVGPITITSNSQLPWSGNIVFTRPSTHIKVKKDFFLFAQPDTQALDLARISLVEQNLVVVPEPTSLAVLGLGALAAVVRKRKRR